MSGKRRRALYAQCKLEIGGIPSRTLFLVDGKGKPVPDGVKGGVAIAGNVFRTFKKRFQRIWANNKPAEMMRFNHRHPKLRSGRRRLQGFHRCVACHFRIESEWSDCTNCGHQEIPF